MSHSRDYNRILMDRITGGLAREGESIFGEPLQINWDQKLGCGSYGCAFTTSQQGVVAKISEDPVEAPMSLAIMNSGLDKKLDGLARVYGTWRVTIGREKVFVILREDVLPVDQALGGEARTIRVLSRAPWVPDLYQLKKTGNHFMGKSKLPEALTNALEHSNLDLWTETESISRALWELYERGLYIWDLHFGNIAFRQYPEGDQEAYTVEWFNGRQMPPLVIYDYGHSYSARTLGKVKKLLENPYYQELAQEVGEL